MNKTGFLFLSFGCIGITTEIIFTSFSDSIISYLDTSNFDMKLIGHSYFWMFFIYGLIAILFPPIYKKVKDFFIVYRLIVYASLIFCIEFISGFMLDQIIGNCPWQYNSKFSICGYIRLDYLFFWMIFGYLIERLYLYLNNMFISSIKK